MTVRLNGTPTDIPSGCSVESLLAFLGLQHAACAVEVNACLVPKARHALTLLKEGDVVELVTLVGGG